MQSCAVAAVRSWVRRIMLTSRQVGPHINGVRRMIPIAMWGMATLIAAAALSVACVSGTTPLDYSLIATSTPPAPPPVALAPNAQGYVRVETKSGSPRCSISRELVACQTSGNNWPSDPRGGRFHTASVGDDGEFHWISADLGALAGRVTMDYQTYTAQGWTIAAAADSTTFTNDRSGRGMSVSDRGVAPF